MINLNKLERLYFECDNDVTIEITLNINGLNFYEKFNIAKGTPLSLDSLDKYNIRNNPLRDLIIGMYHTLAANC